MDTNTSLVIALGVVLLLFVISATILFIWICLKLKQHEDDLNDLQDAKKAPDSLNKQKSYYTNEQLSYFDGLERGSKRKDQRDDQDEISTRKRINSNEVKFRKHHGYHSRQSLAGKRQTLLIQKEEANIYGDRPPLAQIMMTAQSYYRDCKNAKTDVSVESVNVVQGTGQENIRLSKLFNEDWCQGQPTSFLINDSAASFDDILVETKGLFVHKMIGKAGGTLEVSGISLDIPAGALEEERMISLGVLWDKKVKPSLTSKQTILSPVILCQPSGLKFKSFVTLSFPHAADEVSENWKLDILKREGNIHDETSWGEVTPDDLVERHVNNHRIILKLRHFTLYTAVGESQPGKNAAKLVHLVAFTNKLEKNSFFKPRIYCLNRYKDIQYVREMAKDISPSSDLADTTELFVHNNERDLNVEVVRLSNGWKVAGDRTEILPFENVWHDVHPHCTFVMKQERFDVSDIVCEFHAYQCGQENRYAQIKIAEIMTMPSSPLSAVQGDPVEDLIRELVILLDPRNTMDSDSGDWTSLAEKMGCSLPRIRWLGTQVSQTRVLIEKWIEDKRTFSELKEILLQINRPDAAEEVTKRLSELEPNKSLATSSGC